MNGNVRGSWVFAALAIGCWLLIGCGGGKTHYLVEPVDGARSASALVEEYAAGKLREWRAPGEYGEACLLNIEQALPVSSSSRGKGERLYEFLVEGTEARAAVTLVFRYPKDSAGEWVFVRADVSTDKIAVAALEARATARQCAVPAPGGATPSADLAAWRQLEALSLLSQSATWSPQGESYMSSHSPLLGNGRTLTQKTWLIEGTGRPLWLHVTATDVGDGPGITDCKLVALAAPGPSEPLP